MARNRVPFPPGLSMPGPARQFGTGEPCEAALERLRWPQGFRCPRRGERRDCVLRVGARQIFQRGAWRERTSRIAGTVFPGTQLAPVSGFTRQAVAAWASARPAAGSAVVCDRLACFSGVGDAGGVHRPAVVGNCKPRHLPEVLRVNTVLGNVKTRLAGACPAFAFGKYAACSLGAIADRFNRRFQPGTLTQRLLAAAVATGRRPEDWLRPAAARCESGAGKPGLASSAMPFGID